MQLNTIILSLISLSALASAGCFSGGESWDPRFAAGASKRACNRLNGGYTPGQTKVADLNVASGQCYHFSIVAKGCGNQKISKKNCVRNLQKEITGCEHGGRTTSGNWEFTSDPNAGPCNRAAAAAQAAGLPESDVAVEDSTPADDVPVEEDE